MEIKLNLIPPARKEEIRKIYLLRLLARWQVEIFLVLLVFLVLLWNLDYVLKIEATVNLQQIEMSRQSFSFKDMQDYREKIKTANENKRCRRLMCICSCGLCTSRRRLLPSYQKMRWQLLGLKSLKDFGHLLTVTNDRTYCMSAAISAFGRDISKCTNDQLTHWMSRLRSSLTSAQLRLLNGPALGFSAIVGFRLKASPQHGPACHLGTTCA